MKESRKEFIREAHKAACPDWKRKIEKEFPILFEKPKFEIGKWYKSIGGTVVCFQGGKSAYGYWEVTQSWKILDNWSFESNPEAWQPATDKEVEEALIKEAIKRGLNYPNAVCLFDPEDKLDKTKDPKWDFHLRDGVSSLWYYNLNVFKKGKWATLLETITKEEAEKQLGKKIVD